MHRVMLADQLPDAVKGVLLIGGLIAAPLLIGGLGVLGWHVECARARRHESQVRSGILRRNCFDGRDSVDVSPLRWQLDIATVRAIAAERGYLEVQPRFIGAVSFVRSAPSGQSSSAGGQPGAQAVLQRGSAGTGEVSNRESSLLAAARAKGEVWVSLQQYELSRAWLDMLAGMYGIQLVCCCADSTDQLILLPAHQGHRSTPSDPTAKGIRPSFVVMIMSFVIAAGDIASIAVVSQFGYSVIAWFLTIPVFFVLLLPCGLRLVSRSRRARLLNREFNGRACVSIFLRWYGFSGCLASEMAAYCGYRYGETKYHRTQGSYINYVRHRHAAGCSAWTGQ